MGKERKSKVEIWGFLGKSRASSWWPRVTVRRGDYRQATRHSFYASIAHQIQGAVLTPLVLRTLLYSHVARDAKDLVFV